MTANMTANARARMPRTVAWLAAVAVALAIGAACCGRDVPLGVSPAVNAAADGSAGE